MPHVPVDQHKLLLMQQNVGAAHQIVQLTPVNADQLKRLMLFAAEVKIPRAFLKQEGKQAVYLDIP